MTNTTTTAETMDDLEVKILMMQQTALLAFKKANAANLKTIESVDISNRSGTNTGNFMQQMVNQLQNNERQLDSLLKTIDLALNPITEDFTGAGSGLNSAPLRL